MKNLIQKFMSAQTTREVDDIILENLNFMDLYPESFKYARNAKNRIRRIQCQKRLSWKSYQLN